MVWRLLFNPHCCLHNGFNSFYEQNLKFSQRDETRIYNIKCELLWGQRVKGRAIGLRACPKALQPHPFGAHGSCKEPWISPGRSDPTACWAPVLPGLEFKALWNLQPAHLPSDDFFLKRSPPMTARTSVYSIPRSLPWSSSPVTPRSLPVLARLLLALRQLSVLLCGRKWPGTGQSHIWLCLAEFRPRDVTLRYQHNSVHA